MKIIIPDVSDDYKEALFTYLCSTVDPDNFYRHLNLIAGYLQMVDASTSFGDSNLGGCKSLTELLESTEGFPLITMQEYINFTKEDYNSADFMHIFFQAYLTIRGDMKLAGYK